ncbi:hypothetical protein FH581_000655 [Leptospira weilii]|uniref:hypothetical protein n=1 Tax=Leptospira weilii TaxID=28184 RepID=UPI001EF25C68|nr:hypothetical protein [Leptospira weilii]ULH27601.1 hypothetical protein FH586_14470 [Leptospira weilii]ULH27615.1 hypothetical protein FH586_14550 [Leptospira weilii]UPY77377.1 hypothetical protein FH581_000540 [Leptospira weilii]UPY77400.1 hypothetical protein FH581_000655 [Leptospira weilii]
MKGKNETKRDKNGLDPKTREEEAEETSIRKRMKSYRKKYENMSSLKKREEVKTLLQKLKVYQRKIQKLILQLTKVAEQEIEIERKLRVIGGRSIH